MSDVTAGEATLRLERLIPSPPDELFALWTQPAQLAKWWAPDGYQATVHELDVRPGGRWRTTLRAADGRVVATRGVYRVVEPSRRLVFTWAWEDANGAAGHETEVSVTFDATLGGTRLVLVHQRFESRDARDRHAAGWTASFERQAEIVRLGGSP
jgi:uncharacterized protein YndB with AHSA1/START domain